MANFVAAYGAVSSGCAGRAEAAAADGGRRDFSADIEASVGDLPPAFIAAGFDSHFRHMAEKILREEMQHFICSAYYAE